ncbi:rhamnogalacturonan acetylesterase [Roseimarinus sediminis]|uniref:rhamnogalacturonan acetylesterase n=1 Tax=Roseimarinus sediminis TaxID=1610899 RepID=UPI003D1BE937
MNRIVLFVLLALLAGSCVSKEQQKPTLYLIGDSTVKNGRGDGSGGLWGWGDPLVQYFDTTKIDVKNHARGGTSSRTYRSLGLWNEVLEKLQPGDYVLMQFGHNDSGALNDSLRARGTIKGVGDESEAIVNLLTGEHEVVHSYGWYMRQFIQEVKSKGARPVIIAPIPRNKWENGKVPRNDNSYGGWAREVAESESIPFIDLNEKLAAAMEVLGEEQVTGQLFFQHDHTHTTAKGAIVAASKVVEGLKELDHRLVSYLYEAPEINFPVKKKVFLIGDSTVANGKDSIIGWGRELPHFFDTTRVEIINKARGGRSTRSYTYEGLWNEVLDQLEKGDYLLIQFGHNESGNLNKPKFRGSLKGIGDEAEEIIRTDDGQPETVHTYGWYLKMFTEKAQAKGVEVVILSQIPRNIWIDGTVKRENDNYAGWAREAAGEAGAFFLDLHNTVALKYEAMGHDAVQQFFPGDHTHTNERGARLNARTVAELLKNLKSCSLNGYVDRSKLR